jgi:predicted RNase H-like HicB family nuclease
MTYLVIYEKTETGYSAYVPDLIGCVATAESKFEITQNIKEAIEFHLEGLEEEGYEIPIPNSEFELMEVAKCIISKNSPFFNYKFSSKIRGLIGHGGQDFFG